MLNIIEVAFLYLLIKTAIFSFLARVLFAAFARSDGDGGIWRWLLVHTLAAVIITVPVVIFAYFAGYLTGTSGSPAVGNLIPAVLAIIGGLNVYLFNAELKNLALSIYAIFLFALVLFYGVLDGSYWYEHQREDRLLARAEQEFRIRYLRENLNLPADPPAWSIGDN